MNNDVQELKPVPPAPIQSKYEVKAAARRKTIKTFRRFLDALELELDLYQCGPRSDELAIICFKYLRKAARTFRDEPKRANEMAVATILDLTAAWDNYMERQKFTPPLRRFHETLARMVKGALKGWRTYQVQLQLPDSPEVIPERPTEGAEDHGEVRSLD
jgi:hypothetical protein